MLCFKANSTRECNTYKFYSGNKFRRIGIGQMSNPFHHSIFWIFVRDPNNTISNFQRHRIVSFLFYYFFLLLRLLLIFGIRFNLCKYFFGIGTSIWEKNTTISICSLKSNKKNFFLKKLFVFTTTAKCFGILRGNAYARF